MSKVEIVGDRISAPIEWYEKNKSAFANMTEKINRMRELCRVLLRFRKEDCPIDSLKDKTETQIIIHQIPDYIDQDGNPFPITTTGIKFRYGDSIYGTYCWYETSMMTTEIQRDLIMQLLTQKKEFMKKLIEEEANEDKT